MGVINFWATWCEPCRDEMPSMQKLKEELAGRPFAILAVNYGESEPKVADFARRLAVDFPLLLDPNQDAPRAWRVRVLPASFLVDAEGRVRYRVIGEIDWKSSEATETIGRLMRGERSSNGAAREMALARLLPPSAALDR